MLSFGAIAIVFWMLTESLVIMGISLIGYYLLKYSRNKHNHDLIMASSILNLMVLVKPGFYYPAILGTLTLIVFLMIRGRATRWAFLSIFLLSVGLIILSKYNDVSKRMEKQSRPSSAQQLWYHYLGAEAYANAHTMTLDSVKQIKSKTIRK